MITKLLFFDTETTGIQNPRCIQFAYKRFDVQTMQEEACKSLFFKPPCAIEIGAMAVHHITEEAVANEPAFETVRGPVQALVNTHCLVAHNAKFDIGVLSNEGLDMKNVVHICTYKIAVKLFPDFENHQLQYLRYALHVDQPRFHQMQAHDALSDINVLEPVFNALLYKVIEDYGPDTITGSDTVQAALGLMAGWSSQPIILPKIRFGKYKGTTFEELKLRDTGYLEWLYDSERKKHPSERNEDLVYTLMHHLGIRQL